MLNMLVANGSIYILVVKDEKTNTRNS